MLGFLTGLYPVGFEGRIHYNNLRVAILQSIQENLYKENPEDWDSHPEEETTTTGTSGSGNEVGEVRP